MDRSSLRSAALGGALFCLATFSHADEGMWTFDNFPTAAVKQRLGVDIGATWLERVQRSVTRLESGCTGSFVSANGLVLTNHHCALDCLADLSTPEQDLLANGFLAAQSSSERRCESEIVSVLIDTEEVTDQVNAATRGLADAQANAARKRELSRLEQACTEASQRDRRTGPLACESVTLYQGGQYWLYKYKRYDDVRLVFAPEGDIAHFGGDPDNFNFPRWCLDMSMLRVYENGKPARTPDFLRWRAEGPRTGEPVFVTGHPGATNRLLTVSQVDFQRDVSIPAFLIRGSELRGRMIQWGKTGEEPERIIQNTLQIYENALKVYKGWQSALADDSMMQRKAEAEAALREQIESNAELAALIGNPWDQIDAAQSRLRQIFDRYAYLESGSGFNSTLFGWARDIVRGAAERAKPNEERLREYTESNLPKIEATLLAATPVYPDFERLKLSFSLDKMREWLGPDEPIVREVLGTESPDTLAASLIGGTALADPGVRRALWEGGAAAVEASTDPMIVLARNVDAEARAIRRSYEDEVEGPTRTGQEKVAQARFSMLGTSTYPDATFTLRVSYGAVEGWTEGDAPVAPFTRVTRLYERATGKEPFRLPTSWTTARSRLNLDTPFNFATTNDIVGGNSGSPVIDAEGRLVGLAFDGNIHSIAGTYWYDPALNRAVAVHPAIMLEALTKVYGAERLAKEVLSAR